MGGSETSEARRRRDAKRRRRQDKTWESKAGPVSSTFSCICPNPNCRADEHPSESS